MTSKKQRRISALFAALAALVAAFAGCSHPLDASLEEGQGQSRSVGNTLPRQIIPIADADAFVYFVETVLEDPATEGYMTADVDLSGVDFAPIGIDPNTGAVTPYTGTFNGDNHTLSNISINRGKNFAGLFGINNGTIQNLTVTGSVTANYSPANGDIDYVGGIAGYNDINGKIQNVVSKVTVGFSGAGAADHVHNIGGIAGFNGWDEFTAGSPHFGQTYQTGGLIAQCRNEGNVYGGYNKVGGIVGENAFEVTECSNYGKITVTKTETGWIGAGGIVGRNGNNNEATEYGSILDCYNRGTVVDSTTSTTSHNAYGGITGWCNNNSKVVNCYTSGDFAMGDGSLVYGQKNPIIGRIDTPIDRGGNNYSRYGIYYDPANPSTQQDVLVGIVTAEADMKAPGFAADISTAYVDVPNDYPILAWEVNNPPPQL
jgi:hypothetical protein